MEPTRTVLFVCLHGAAKSVLAAADFQDLADQRGAPVRAVAAGIEPDPEVSPTVAEALLQEGIDVRGHRPRRVTREELVNAWRVVSFGCDLVELAGPRVTVDRWDDVPVVSDGFEAAGDRIAARLPALLDAAAGPERSRPP